MAIPNTTGDAPLLTPGTAHRIWCARTRTTINRSTFYRWLGGGFMPTYRLGAKQRLYIRWADFNRVLNRCLTPHQGW